MSAYPDALADALDDTGLPLQNFPADCPFTVAQVLDSAYVPRGRCVVCAGERIVLAWLNAC